MLSLEILFWLCAMISEKETSGSGTLPAGVFSLAVTAYGGKRNRIKGCKALALLRDK